MGVFPHWHCEKSSFGRVKARLRLAGQASDNKVQGCEQRQADRPDNQSANERERESWLPGERERERKRQRPPGQGQEAKEATQGERERENGRQRPRVLRGIHDGRPHGERGGTPSVRQRQCLSRLSAIETVPGTGRETSLSTRTESREAEKPLYPRRESPEKQRECLYARESQRERERILPLSRAMTPNRERTSGRILSSSVHSLGNREREGERGRKPQAG